MTFKMVVEKSSAVDAGERIVYVGEGGIGKTTAISQMPAPFLIDLNAGSSAIDIDRPKQEAMPRTWEDFVAAVEWFASAPEAAQYKTLGIDRLEEVETMLFAYMAKTNLVQKDKDWIVKPCRSIEEVGGGYQKGYTLAAAEVAKSLTPIFDRIAAQGRHVAMTSHPKIEKVKNALGPDYLRYTMNLHRTVADVIFGNADEVLYIRLDISASKDLHGVGETKVVKAAGGDNRFVYSSERAGFRAKNRRKLPFKMVFSWENIAKAIAVAKNSSSLRSSIEFRAQSLPEAIVAQVKEAVGRAADDREKLAKLSDWVDRQIEKAEADEEARIAAELAKTNGYSNGASVAVESVSQATVD